MLCALPLGVCTLGEDHKSDRPPSAADGLLLVSDDWKIFEMATAHGAFTVEVEVAHGVDTTTLARRLIEPLQEEYLEVLVYFYDRAADTNLPVLRVQWTAADGYAETPYQ